MHEGCAQRTPERSGSLAWCDPESSSVGNNVRAMYPTRGTILQVGPGLFRVIIERRNAQGRTDPGTKRSRISESGRQDVGHTA